MEFWNNDAVETVSQAMLKHGKDGVPMTCAKFMSLMGLDAEHEDEVRLIVKRKLSHLIAVKHGPGGGFYLKEAAVTKKADTSLLRQDIIDKIEGALSKNKKISVQDIMMDLGVKRRADITDLLVEMEDYEMVKGVGIVYSKKKRVSKMTPEMIARIEGKKPDDEIVNT